MRYLDLGPASCLMMSLCWSHLSSGPNRHRSGQNTVKPDCDSFSNRLVPNQRTVPCPDFDGIAFNYSHIELPAIFGTPQVSGESKWEEASSAQQRPSTHIHIKELTVKTIEEPIQLYCLARTTELYDIHTHGRRFYACLVIRFGSMDRSNALGLDDVGTNSLLRALKYLVADGLGQLALRGPLGNATEVQARAQVVRHEAEDVDRPAVVFYC